MSQFKGFELFDDIEDFVLRARNRAVVMANIAEDNTKANMISPKGAGLVLGYFNAIPEDERKLATEKFMENMKQRGYAV